MKTKLLLFPFNGNAIEALDCASEEIEVVGFVDDSPEKIGNEYQGIRIYNRDILANENYKVMAVPGSPTSFKLRKEIIDSLGIDEFRFFNLIHPRAFVADGVKLGYNNLIMAGTVITSNVVIGSCNCILPNTVIHHDSVIGDYNLIGSNVTIPGNVELGNNNYIGSATAFKNDLSIGDFNLFGLGSNVIQSIESFNVMYGNPAKPK